MADRNLVPTLTLLLTATIDPRDCFFVSRRDPLVRLADYKAAFTKWIHDPYISNIVLCENSGYDLDELKRIADRDNWRGKDVTILSHVMPSPKNRGKGYGDLGIIQAVISRMNFRAGDRILRVTGRYFVTNIASVLNDIAQNGGSDIITSKPRHQNTWIDSECYCGTRAFMEEYFCKRQHEIDDSRRIYIEHVLASSIREACADGLKHSVFTTSPLISGVSGTHNVSWETLNGRDHGFGRHQ
jgi:hypothetical protein